MFGGFSKGVFGLVVIKEEGERKFIEFYGGLKLFFYERGSDRGDVRIMIMVMVDVVIGITVV